MAKSKTGMAGIDAFAKKNSPIKSMTSTPAKEVEQDSDDYKKFASYIRPSVKKMLKQASIDMDQKEYQIIEAALLDYLRK